jgi:thioredoxin reductase
VTHGRATHPSEADVVVVGGGMAGLSAGLWLGRYRRRVVVFDAGPGRNQPAGGVHGYPGVKDPKPARLRATLRAQARDVGVTIERAEVVDVRGAKGGFHIGLAAGGDIACQRIVLGYGLRDYVPAVPGFVDHYGSAVFHCPDCDGPGVRDMRVGVLGWDFHAAALALFLLTWTERVTLFTHGCALEIDDAVLRVLADDGIGVRTETLARAHGDGHALAAVELETGESVPVDAVFFHLGSEPRCDLAARLGCETDDDGYIIVDRGQETSVPGVYAAGDITGHPHLAVTAAAEGVRAALTAHRSLLPSHRHLRR